MTSPERMRLENEKKILQVVHENPGIYRKLVAEKVDLSSQIVTNLVTQLIQKKLLRERMLKTEVRGRAPMSLEMNYSGLYMYSE